jgi:undecaprenyl phosphate N,N'-diacetylbacillosamine 1-phosphate transferase
MYKNYIKKILDFTIALLGIIVLSPIFVILIIGLFLANKGMPFFFQVRVGINEKTFRIIKFKTMTDVTNKKGDLLPDSERLTKIGTFVRKTSLDELPQLFNILKGDMSLVGPRPLLTEYLPFYNTEQRKRHQVKPGITGMAQVNGRNAIDWNKKLEYDVFYVKNYSFLIDLNIFLRTVIKVFKSEGISANGHATIQTFIEYVNNKKND